LYKTLDAVIVHIKTFMYICAYDSIYIVYSFWLHNCVASESSTRKKVITRVHSPDTFDKYRS